MTPFERIDRLVRLYNQQLRPDTPDVERWDCWAMDAPEAVPAGSMFQYQVYRGKIIVELLRYLDAACPTAASPAAEVAERIANLCALARSNQRAPDAGAQ